MTNELAVLIERLKEKQGEQSDAEFAEKLGVSRQLWGLIKTGVHETPGSKFITAVMRTFPELTGDVINYLASPKDLMTEPANGNS